MKRYRGVKLVITDTMFKVKKRKTWFGLILFHVNIAVYRIYVIIRNNFLNIFFFFLKICYHSHSIEIYLFTLISTRFSFWKMEQFLPCITYLFVISFIRFIYFHFYLPCYLHKWIMKAKLFLYLFDLYIFIYLFIISLTVFTKLQNPI